MANILILDNFLIRPTTPELSFSTSSLMKPASVRAVCASWLKVYVKSYLVSKTYLLLTTFRRRPRHISQWGGTMSQVL